MSTNNPPDDDMPIGTLAALSGVAASALRYYEKQRLLKPARRVSGKRRYDRLALDRVRMIRLAQHVGFSLSEVRTLLAGFDRDGLPASWQRMATAKIAELEADLARIQAMKKMLALAMRCGCADLAACARAAERLPVLP